MLLFVKEHRIRLLNEHLILRVHHSIVLSRLSVLNKIALSVQILQDRDVVLLILLGNAQLDIGLTPIRAKHGLIIGHVLCDAHPILPLPTINIVKV